MHGPRLALVGLLVCLSGCGPAGNDRFLLDAARQVLPAVAPLNTTGQPLTADQWRAGNVYYELFTALRDFDPAKDEGKVGVDNVFASIYLAGLYYAGNYDKLAPITPHPVASPFPFKSLDATLTEVPYSDTYERGKNLLTTGGTETTEINMAAREVNKEKHWLLSFKNQGGWNVIQGSQDESTGDLELNLTSAALEGTSTGYIQRNYVRGNTRSHAFVLKMIKYNAITNGYKLALVGKGVSRGAGNYFLFRLKDNNLNNATMGPGEGGAYYCVAGDASETTLSAASTNAGSATVDANCASLQTDVDRMWRDVWTIGAATDVPTSAASFANSSLQLSL